MTVLLLAVPSVVGASTDGPAPSPSARQVSTLSLAPPVATYGPTAVGDLSPSQPFSVDNTGAAPVTITGITASAEWVITSDGCTGVVDAGASCQVHVAFAPAAGGERTGTLTVTSSAPTVQAQLSGAGLGPALQVTPAAVDFGAVDVGETSTEVIVTVSNTGTEATTALPVTAPPFAIPTTMCGFLTPGTSCTVSVAFQPTSAGSATGTLTVSGSGTSTESILLTGLGAVRTATLAPTTIDFGGVALHDGADVELVLHNTGNVPLTAFGESTPDAVSSTIPPCLLEPLPPDARCTFGLRFAPTLPGAFTGSYVLMTSSGDLTASLTGTGLPLAVTPTDLDLGDVTVSHDRSATVTITNLADGPVPLARSAAATPFTLTDDCPEPLPGLGSCTVTVTFAPTEAVDATSSFTVSSPADGSVQAVTVDLAGRGLAADLSIEPLDLGPVPVGESATTTATVTNTGGAAVTVTDVTVPAPFGVVSAEPCVGDLEPQGSCDVEVTFTPTDPGAASETLAVHHRAGEATATAQGFGATIGLDVTPATVPPTAPPPGATAPAASATAPSSSTTLPATGTTSPLAPLTVATGLIAIGLALATVRRRDRPSTVHADEP